MVGRGVRRFPSALSVVAIVASLLALPVSVSGCDTKHLSDEFNARHCMGGDSPRVSANRVVTLYAINHVYYCSVCPEDGDVRIYRNQAEELINQAYDVANRIFVRTTST